MKDKSKSIRFTNHAKRKMIQRNISNENVVSILNNPEFKEQDKFDDALTHLIGKINVAN